MVFIEDQTINEDANGMDLNDDCSFYGYFNIFIAICPTK